MASPRWPPLVGVHGSVPASGPATPERELLNGSHLALLLDLARALSAAVDHGALPVIAAQRIRLLTGAAGTRLSDLDETRSLRIVAESSTARPDAECGSQPSPTASAPELEVLRTGAPVWIGTTASALARFGCVPLTELAERAVAWAFLPLVAEEQLSGVLALAFADPPELDDVHRAFLAEVASECANALARASLFARERARADASEDARADAEARRSRSERLVRDRSHLFERERFARARAEAGIAQAIEFAEGMERSQRLTAALACAGSVPSAIAALTAHAPKAFGALGFTLAWERLDGGLEAVVAPPMRGKAVNAAERLSVGGGWADAEVFRSGAARWLDARDATRRFPATADVLASLGGESWLGVPVRRGPAVGGVLALVLASRDLTVVERGRLTALAEECASVLAEREGHGAAATLPAGEKRPAPVEHVAEYEEAGPRGAETHVLGVFSCECAARTALRETFRQRPSIVRAWITSWNVDVPAERTRAEVTTDAG